MMSGPGLDWTAVEKLMHADEERLRSPSALSASESCWTWCLAFSQPWPKSNGGLMPWDCSCSDLAPRVVILEEQRALSAALCASQLRLARLCTRNMRCFAQQAIQKKEGESRNTSSSGSSGGNRSVSSSGSSKLLRETYRDQGSTELSTSPLIQRNLLDISDFDEVEAAFSSMMEDGSSSQEVLSTPFSVPEDNHVDNDYDPKDFVVHRNTFITTEDYHSEDSTLPGSSPQPLVREASSDASDDDEVDYHLPYDEHEEEMQQRNYDSRHHYAFYPEETELEVIPEEDEDHASNSDCSDPMGERSRMTEHDSGVTDEQHSSGSDDDRRHGKRSEDTDSGLHSLPWTRDCDSSRGSPETSPDTKEQPAIKLNTKLETKLESKPEPRQASRHSSDVPRATVSIQCNGPDSLRNVLSAQHNDLGPRGPELLKGSRLAELIKSFEQVSVSTMNGQSPLSSRTMTGPTSPSPATAAALTVAARSRPAKAVTTVTVNHVTANNCPSWMTIGSTSPVTPAHVQASVDEELLPRSSTLMWNPVGGLYL
ncbi:hypothetical protein MRX96_017148 [Rhipicephalus microplus]